MRNEKGITLIALVITIIVLLILAGISIAMLTGDNGLLTKSQESVKDNAIAGAKDKLSIAEQEGMTTYLAKYYAETNTTTKAGYNIITDVETAMKKVETSTNTNSTFTVNGCNVEISAVENGAGTITITYDNRRCVGNVTTTAGDSNKAGTYKIDWQPITTITL